MATFAELDDNNCVVQVVVINDEDCLDENGNESEEVGVAFCQSLYGGRWLQTSINTRGNVHYMPDGVTPSGQPPFRANYGSVGSVYVAERDVFVNPKPYDWYRFDPVMLDWYCPHDIDPETGQLDDARRGGYILQVPLKVDGSDVFVDGLLMHQYCTKNDYYAVDLNAAYNLMQTGDLNTNDNWMMAALFDRFGIEFASMMKHSVVFDLTPIAQINYLYVLDENMYDAFAPLRERMRNLSIPYGAPTLHELFRLIIEWAWAHTDLGNEEYPARYCHNILRVLQMPLNVRDALIEQVPYQQVGKFLARDPEARVLRDLDEIVPCPLEFTEWLDGVLNTYKFRQHNTDFNFDPNNISYSYPGGE